MTELQRLARCLADDYQFECQGGPLRNCTEWRALCAAIDTLAVDPPPSGASPQAETLGDAVSALWRALCEGDGKHSEMLDRSIIATHLERYAAQKPALVSPVEPPSEDEDDDVPLLAPEGAMDSWSAPLRKPVPLKILSDPWARVIPLRPNPYSHQNYYVEEEVDSARAAVERQHAEELADCAQAHATERDLAIAVIAEQHAAALENMQKHCASAADEAATLHAQVETLTAERDEARAANTANLREMVAMEGRYRASLAAVEGELVRFKAAFFELHATVTGECPSLLDPCRGGSDVLRTLCDAALTSPTQETSK